MRIDELMSRDVHYCLPEQSLAGAAYEMWNHDCGCLPVCAGNGTPHIVGIITDRDICMAALFQGRSLRELKVVDAMSRDVRSCRANDRPAEVERVMREQQIRRLPVTDRQGKLVGIVSLADLALEAGDGDPSAKISETEIGSTLAAICEPASRTRTIA